MEVKNLNSAYGYNPGVERPKNPLKMMIGNLPEEKSEELKSIMKSLSESEKATLKTELEKFKPAADNMSKEERADGIYQIFQNLFGEKFSSENSGENQIDVYI